MAKIVMPTSQKMSTPCRRPLQAYCKASLNRDLNALFLHCQRHQTAEHVALSRVCVISHIRTINMLLLGNNSTSKNRITGQRNTNIRAIPVPRRLPNHNRSNGQNK